MSHLERRHDAAIEVGEAVFARELAGADRLLAPSGSVGIRGQGYRGAPAVDIDAVCEAIARISEFAADHRDVVEEIDVNPLLARVDGAIALDALIVLRDKP